MAPHHVSGFKQVVPDPGGQRILLKLTIVLRVGFATLLELLGSMMVLGSPGLNGGGSVG